jgi:hypothetical protein
MPRNSTGQSAVVDEQQSVARQVEHGRFICPV